MTGPDPLAVLDRGFELLERAIAYALSTLGAVRDEALAWPTPCHDWDLAALLRHFGDSLGVLHGAIGNGWVGLEQPAADRTANAAELAAAVRGSARGLLAAGERAAPVVVGDLPLPAAIVAGTGALEIAVHGWDVGQSCGPGAPIPAALATDLLVLYPLTVAGPGRGGQFAPPLPVPAGAGPGERLVALLGRSAAVFEKLGRLPPG